MLDRKFARSREQSRPSRAPQSRVVQAEACATREGGDPVTCRGPSSGPREFPIEHLAFGSVPIYEYRCPNGHTFEVFKRMSDPPAETCVTCGAGPVEKILFPVAVHFKGSGFYSTDYGKGKKKPRESDTAAAGDKTADKPAEKVSSETKPKPSADAS